MSIRALVPIGFWDRDGWGAHLAVEALLPLKDVVWVGVLYDQHGPSVRVALDVVARWQSEFAAAHKNQLVAVPAKAGETGTRWEIGKEDSRRVPGDFVLFVPGDTAKPATSAAIAALRSRFFADIARLVDRAARDTLIVGDYSHPDWFKSVFDALLLDPLMSDLLPDARRRLEEVLVLSKKRTEFVGAGDLVWEALDRERDTGLRPGGDPTPQWLEVAARTPGVRVVRVPVGPFLDQGHSHVGLSSVQQAVRILGQLANDRLTFDLRSVVASPKDHRTAKERELCLQFVADLRRAVEKLFSALDQILLHGSDSAAVEVRS